MDRRHYLALLAGVGTAGCSTDDLPVPGGDTPTPGAGPTATPTGTEQPTETEIDQATDTETETEEQLSQEELEASRRIREADTALGEGLDRYAAVASAETILEVRASAGGFGTTSVREKVEEAGRRLDEASENANETQRQRIARLRGVARFVRRAARAQSALGRAYERLVPIHQAYLDEDFGRVNGNRDRFRDRIADAESAFRRATDNTTADQTEASESLDRSTYERKREQLDLTIVAFRRLADAIDRYTDRMRYWRDGVEKYTSERWTPASEDFEDAAPLRDVADGIEADAVDDDPTDARLDDLREVARTLGEAAVEMEASASAYRVRDREEGRARLDDARLVIDDARIVRRNVESAGDVQDFEEP